MCDFGSKNSDPLDETYQAPYFVIGIFLVYFWSQLWIKLVAWKPALRTKERFVNFWVFTSIALVYFYVLGVKGMYKEVLEPTKWLDPEKTEFYVERIIAKDLAVCNDTKEDQEAFKNWEEEAKLDQGLRWMSILSPVWTFGTIVVCLAHTYFHVDRVHKNNVAISETQDSEKVYALSEANISHESIIWVLALPAIYGLMAMKSVIRMQQVAVNHIGTNGVKRFRNYDHREFLLTQISETNAYVGDFYETWCLIALGRLLLRMLAKATDKQAEDFFMGGAKGKKGLGAVKEDLTEPLVGAVDEVSMVGIKSFYFVCVLQAIWYIFGCQMTYSGFEPKYFKMGSNDEGNGIFWQSKFYDPAYYLDYGAGLVASCVAIYDLIALEHHFLKFYEKIDFEKVKAKFWATKVLVSLAFLQSIVKHLMPLSEVRANLLFSSLLCVECFFIALSHIYAWGHNEKWLSVEAGMKEKFLST